MKNILKDTIGILLHGTECASLVELHEKLKLAERRYIETYIQDNPDGTISIKKNSRYSFRAGQAIVGDKVEK